MFTSSSCPLTFTTQGSTKRHMTSAHRQERPFMCPFCQKTFKTSVLCKKHMKIHRRDLALKDSGNSSNTLEIPSQEILNNTVDVNTPNTLTTIETADMTNTIPNNPTTEINNKNDVTFLTADSSGTVTLPNYPTAPPMNIGQSEVILFIKLYLDHEQSKMSKSSKKETI